ncbi:MAG: hypothetical protein LBL62_04615, partial [Planctomycetaceae bacterium]|nr:hypothetical protein [Planctomycetaceae bacterium]
VDSGELSYDSACVPHYSLSTIHYSLIHCPFRAIVREGLTHRVAVGCYALPLQGGGKLAILQKDEVDA